jgi:exopolysaccharide biosynthesis polyprenyl glycosylphosphotransferase
MTAPTIVDRPGRGKPTFSYPVRHRGPNYALMSMFLDSVGSLLALFLAGVITRMVWSDDVTVSWPIFTFLALDWIITFFLLSIYDTTRAQRFSEEARRVIIAVGLSTLIFMGMLYLSDIILPRTLILSMFALDIVFLVGWRFADRIRPYLSRSKSPAMQRVLIIGANELGKQVVDVISKSPWSRLEVFGFLDDEKKGAYNNLPVVGGLNEVRSMVEMHGIEEVVVALPHKAYDKLNQIVVDLQSLPVQVRVVPSYLSLALYRATVDDMGGLPLINLRDTALTPSQRLVKRAFDIAVSATVLVLIAPVLLLIALAIKLDTPGPVLFKQLRVGENGKLFRMYKFRSMVVNAEALQHLVNEKDENGNTIHKKRNDPRVTRAGRIIRKTSLDELPQFINVLRGEMSLVGPRPELPWLVEQYQPWQRQRFAVPQGITGWWQVNGRSDLPCHLNTDQDLYYIQNYSFLLDVQILLRTVPALLKGKGAF